MAMNDKVALADLHQVDEAKELLQVPKQLGNSHFVIFYDFLIRSIVNMFAFLVISWIMKWNHGISGILHS